MDAKSDDFCSQLAKADAAYLWYGKEVFVGCGQKGRFWSHAGYFARGLKLQLPW